MTMISADDILRLCREQGFALSGIAPAEPIAHQREFLDWLDAGRHGEMHWLAEHLEQRFDPRIRLCGAKSIIVVGDRHATFTPSRRRSVTPSSSKGRIARYALGDDYHRVMKKRLHALCDHLAAAHPGERFIAGVDTAPVVEREHAVRAGIGYVGKNTMLIEPGVGSWFLLGEIITTLAIDAQPQTVGDHCGQCARCLDACPTQALTPYALDATKCISYLTIEHRSTIDERFHEAMGDWIFGCDICQEVCPHNGGQGSEVGARHIAPGLPGETAPLESDASGVDRASSPGKPGAMWSNREPRTPNPAYTPRRDGFDLLEVLGWTEEDRRREFTRSAMKRAKLWMMKRNALIAAGNHLRRASLRTENGEQLLARIRHIAHDEGEHDVVRQTAATVLAGIECAGT